MIILYLWGIGILFVIAFVGRASKNDNPLNDPE